MYSVGVIHLIKTDSLIIQLIKKRPLVHHYQIAIVSLQLNTI